MKNNGSLSANFQEPYITPSEFRDTLQAIARQLAEDEKTRIGKFNELAKAINNLNHTMDQLAQAQNTTAEIVDSALLSIRWLLEKNGGWDAEGHATPEYAEWVAKVVADSNAEREANDLAVLEAQAAQVPPEELN